MFSKYRTIEFFFTKKIVNHYIFHTYGYFHADKNMKCDHSQRLVVMTLRKSFLAPLFVACTFFQRKKRAQKAALFLGM